MFKNLLFLLRSCLLCLQHLLEINLAKVGKIDATLIVAMRLAGT